MQDTEILFHTPGPAEAAFPYHVLAAGRTLARPGDPPVRRRYNQHVLILTETGEGLIEVQGRRWRAGPGALAWLDTGRDYAHGCDPAAPLWQYLWIGVQGFGLDRLAPGPVTQPGNPQAAALILDILAQLRARGPGLAPRTSAGVAALIALILGGDEPGAPALRRIAPLAHRLRAALADRWTVPRLAAEARLSPPQLHRLFRAETGLSPMEWLRRERITAAKPLLLDPALSVQQVAEAVGYADPFHFSRDFRRLTGQPPRSFRNAGGT